MKQTNALKMELPGSSKYKLADLDTADSWRVMVVVNG